MESLDHGQRKQRTVRLRACLLVVPVVIASVMSGLTGAASAASTGPREAFDRFGYPYFFAPDCNEENTADGSCIDDHWFFIAAQCTSWVAYRLNQLNGIVFNNAYGQPPGQRWSNANLWDEAADRAGITRNDTAALGAVAQWDSNGWGHVAYVEDVKNKNTIVISEMNYDGHNGFRLVTLKRNEDRWPTQFIHIADR